jgi:GR25 family glycosyltransferase involved in LPS biosynthesis
LIEILIPTYKRNNSLQRLLKILNENIIFSRDKVLIRIVDNDVNNQFNYSRFKNVKIIYKKNKKNIGGNGSFRILLKNFTKSKNSKYALFLSDDDIPINFKNLLSIIKKVVNSKKIDFIQINSILKEKKKLLSFTLSPALKIYNQSYFLDKCTVMTGVYISKNLARKFLKYQNKFIFTKSLAYPMQLVALLSNHNFFLYKPFFIHEINNKTHRGHYKDSRYSFWIQRILFYYFFYKQSKNLSKKKICYSLLKTFICRNYNTLNIYKKELEQLKDLPFSIEQFNSNNFLNAKIKQFFFIILQKFFKFFEKIFLIIYLRNNRN